MKIHHSNDHLSAKNGRKRPDVLLACVDTAETGRLRFRDRRTGVQVTNAVSQVTNIVRRSIGQGRNDAGAARDAAGGEDTGTKLCSDAH